MLTQEQINQFEQEGYLAVDNLLSEDYLSALKNEYNGALNKLCDDWLRQGLITESYAELACEERLVELFKSGGDYAAHMDISLPFTAGTNRAIKCFWNVFP